MSYQRAKLTSLVVALTVHGAVAMQLIPGPALQSEAAAGVAQARIGTSFADMTMGALPSQTAVEQTPRTPAITHQPQAAAPLSPVLEPVVPSVIAGNSPQRAEAVQSAEMAKPRVEKRVLEPVQSAPKVRQAAADTPRPRLRAEKIKQPKPPSTAGNAPANARAGSTTGTKQATAKQQGVAKGKSKQSGTATVSNYAGEVMRRIARVPRPRVRGGGAAVVVFAVAHSGQLASVSLGQSSGSASLDQAALRLVRQAAPFPIPPSGAQRRFSIRIEGR